MKERLAAISARLPPSPAGRLEAIVNMASGVPVVDENGRMVDRTEPVITKKDAAELLNDFDPAPHVSTPRCTYEPPRGPCGVCWYCKQAEAPVRAMMRDPRAKLRDLAEAAYKIGMRLTIPTLIPNGGPFAAGWRAWGGPK